MLEDQRLKDNQKEGRQMTKWKEEIQINTDPEHTRNMDDSASVLIQISGPEPSTLDKICDFFSICTKSTH